MSTGSRIAVAAAAGIGLLLVSAVAGIVLARGASGQDPRPVQIREVTVRHAPADEVEVPPVLGALDPETVLELTLLGFPPDTTGTVRQCLRGESPRCDSPIPVRFDGDGAARIQFLVTDAVGGPGRCRLGQDRCTVEIAAGADEAVIDTVFVDDAPPIGRITLDPPSGLTHGALVTVSASNFPARVPLVVRVCADPAARGSRCGAPGPEIELTTDADGRAEATFILDVDEVGEDAVACGRRTRCRLVVDSPAAAVRARPVTLSFASGVGTGATYDPTRVVAGLAVAVALLAVAVVLTRSVDWRPPAEADGSLIDDAAYADLDAEAAAFEEVPA